MTGNIVERDSGYSVRPTGNLMGVQGPTSLVWAVERDGDREHQGAAGQELRDPSVGSATNRQSQALGTGCLSTPSQG